MTARRWWALPLVPVYAAVLWLVRRLRHLGWLESRHLAWPVVSVGSLSAGGAGKTPAVLALANLLSDHGWVVDVLSRGYGRDSDKNAVDLVDPDLVDAAVRFGDEPTLIAQSTGVPVWVSADRYLAGSRAEVFAGGDRWDWDADTVVPVSQLPRIHLLDDGFQHGRLVRELDVLLVTPEDVKDWLLPVGNLREPLKAIRRADVIVMREEDAAQLQVPLRRYVDAHLREKPLRIWIIKRRLQLPVPTVSIASGEPCYLAGARPLVFCGLARPQGFLDQLKADGCPVLDKVIFRDHHRYTGEDIQALVETARQLEATGFITTEKDAVKLSPSMRERLEEVGPLMIVGLCAEFLKPEAVLADIEAAAASARARLEGTGAPAE